FNVTEQGTLRPLTAFAGSNSPISLVIVGSSLPSEVLALRQAGSEILAAQSVAEALRALAASKNSRKALIFTTGSIVGEIPSEIQVLKADQQNLLKSLLDAMNSYSLWFT